MRELDTYEVVEIERVGRGHDGVFANYMFTNVSAEMIIKTLSEGDDRLATVIEEEELLTTVIRSHLQDFTA